MLSSPLISNPGTGGGADGGTELKDMKKDDDHIVIINANNEEGKAEIMQLEFKHKATDFADKGAEEDIGAIKEREGFFKFLARKDVPHRAVILTFAFIFIGIFLFCLGFFKNMREWDPFHGFLFWGAGLVLFVPGSYFFYKLLQAYNAPDIYARKNLLSEIPQM